ncbi:PAS domain-containing protein [Arthrospiribacter ruber]|uniref:histidine kinase n=1 Tax=Arthrospiribacter ruber TaxID=2487934 RepID=A0A951IRA4_9BACT|nr:PAS domain-containing protein [Arthrospiribacter ruber]MBW3466470.1 diguanylate cyclase [Arthrospiribacter ruber]
MKTTSTLPTDLFDLIHQSGQLFMLILNEQNLITGFNALLDSQLPDFGSSISAKSLSAIIYPQDFSNYTFLLKNALESKKSSFQIDLRVLNKDGEDFKWTRWEFKIGVINGQKRILGIGYPISKYLPHHIEVPRNLNELQIKNEILGGLFEDHLLGFWIWDLIKKKDYLSDSFLNMLKYTSKPERSQKPSVKWKKHIHPEDQKEVKTLLKQHFESMGNTPFHHEFRLLTLENETINILCYAKVISWSESNQPLLMIGGIFDISEKKKSDLLLDKQNKFLKDLTFNQSHMMRAKLANVLGILEVINLKDDLAEAKELLAIVKKEALKLDQVLQESIHASSTLNSD